MGTPKSGLSRCRVGCVAPLLFATFAGLSSSAHASAWSRDDGELMLISRADYFRSDLGNISVGGEEVDGSFERIEANTYVEYGLTNRLTIGGKALYGTSWLTRGSSVETTSGFTEFESFAQYQVSRNERHAAAVKLTGAIPTRLESGARPSTQSNGADVEISALYGRSITFKPVKTFASAEIGYRRRFSDAADQLRLLTTIGVETGRRWTVLLDMFSVKSLGNQRLDGADFDVVKIQPSIVWRASRRFSFQAGVTEEVAGRNLALGTTYFIGMRTQF